MRRFISCLIVLSTVASCVDRVELPVRTEEPRLVVDGQITNEAPPYGVRLTYTGQYGGLNGQNPANQYVRDAQVSLADDQGRLTTLVSKGFGIYQTTDSTFRGQVGRAYTLTVLLADGKRYVTKAERMPAVSIIDSISAKVIQSGNQAVPYQVAYAVNTNDPASEKNYYRWTAFGYTNRLSVGVPCSLGSPSLCNNRCWTLVSSDAINVYSDDAVNGNPIRGRVVFQVPIYAIAPQLIEIVQYGITQTNYQFWKLYQQQSARTGSIFDPLPAPVTGNVVNDSDPSDRARGYFAVTSITRKRYRQQTYNAPFYGALTTFLFNQPVPPGDCRSTYGPVPVSEPDGW